MTFIVLEYKTGTKLRAHNCIFTSLGTSVLEKLGTCKLAKKLEGTLFVSPLLDHEIFCTRNRKKCFTKLDVIYNWRRRRSIVDR